MDIDLNFSDDELAKELLASTPPKGVALSSSGQPTIRAATGADIVFSVSLHIKDGIELAVVALWAAHQIRQHLKKRSQEKARINDKEVTPTPEQILVLMRDVVHWQQVRDAQWKESQQKKLTDENQTP